MASKYKTFEDVEDDREFQFGQIWKVRDKFVSLLPVDRVDVKRTVHPCRLIVITQNCDENSNKLFPIIKVAPLASETKYLQKYDVLLEKDRNAFGIDKDKCMVQMQLEQPMLKKDLYEQIGNISDEKKFELLAIEAELIGIDIETDDDSESAS